MSVPVKLTPRCTSLIAEIRTALDSVASTKSADNPSEIAHRVRNILEKYLSYDDLLNPENCQSSEESYYQNLLHVEPNGAFSVVALVWLPGQFTPIHDHIAWCVVGTYRGAEEEIRYDLITRDEKEYLSPIAVNVTPPGTAMLIIPPGDIHKVRNSAESRTISIHIYGADLSVTHTSIRRRYNHPVLASGDGKSPGNGQAAGSE